MTSEKRKGKRGFASMDQEQQRAIASKGGASIKPENRSFSRDHALAVEAGRKGGKSVRKKNRSFSRDRELAAESGRKGGLSRAAKRAKPV